MSSVIYVKENLGAGKESYWFTDGANALSKDFTFKQMIEQVRFLKSIGIKVESHVVDVNQY